MLTVESLSVLGFRNLTAAEIPLGPDINLVRGSNGAGKSNLLDAVYTALAGRSCRTRRDREAIAFGEPLARAEATVAGGGERHAFLTALTRDGTRHHRVDGSPAGPEHLRVRPPLAVFLPERLALVKGPPAARRAHLDGFCAALRPSRADSRRRYTRALTQRNALLSRARGSASPPPTLDAWDTELAIRGAELIAARAEAAETLAPRFAAACEVLGVGAPASVAYAPRSHARSAEELLSELSERRAGDLARGHTGHGPHLDELALRLDGRPLRRYGSQGQQRVAVLALLFAEREALIEAGRPPPLMLLDDVTSELDGERRALLCHSLARGGGQAIITATDASQLPAGRRAEIVIRDGRALAGAAEAA